VGELRDVALDGVAVAAGLLLAVTLDPPARWQERMSRRRRRSAGLWLSAAVVGIAAVIQVAHLGHRIDEPGVAVFWSRFTREDLVRLSAERRVAWAAAPPVRAALWSREDQYLAEGLWHAQARNVAWTSADLFTAWRENLILERFFEPVLERPSDGASAGARWSPDQRALAATQMQFDPAFYLSHAAPLPIAEWPSWCLWLSVGAIVVAILTAC
jgi:hypothetical protein